MINTVKLIKFGLTLGDAVAPNLNSKLAFRLFRQPLSHKPKVPAGWQLGPRHDLPFLDGHIATYEWLPENGAWSETIILTHGWGANANSLHAFVQPLVNHGFRVIAWDGPAHGESSGKITTLPEWVQALHMLCIHYGPLAGLVGHSFGGMVAGMLVGGAPLFGLEPVVIPKLVTIGAPESIQEIVDQFGSILEEIPQGVSKGIIAQIEALMGYPIDTFDLERVLPESNSDTLVVHDRNDSRVPYDNALTISNSLPSGELLTTEGLGHRRILRDEAVITAACEYMIRERITA